MGKKAVDFLQDSGASGFDWGIKLVCLKMNMNKLTIIKQC